MLVYTLKVSPNFKHYIVEFRDRLPYFKTREVPTSVEMSNIYIQEPPSNGKVLLKTSMGDIDIELWSKEAPKACRNFVQLCLEGYYDNSIFHRIIKGFIVQGGDPTGTGEGGQSIYGEPFKDEFHSRLKFSRRGLVAMANAGPNDNASQFFFALERCEHLNNKHTIFGKVVGNTVFNMLKLGEVEVDGEDRPVYPPKIKSTEVLANPFDDIVPRETTKNKEEKKKKKKVKGTKNFSLLSFGEEAEEDEVETQQASKKMKNKSKSAHDLTRDRTLSSAPAIPKSPPPQDSKRKRSFSGEDGALSSPDGKQPSGAAEDVAQALKKHKGELDNDVEKGENVNIDGEATIQPKIDQDNKNTDSERTSKDENDAVKRGEVNNQNKKSRWDKIPENPPPETPVAKADKKDQLSGAVKNPDEDKIVEKKGGKESERTSERKDQERSSNRDSQADGGEKRQRSNRDVERGSSRHESGRSERDRGRRDNRDSERYEKRDIRDAEKKQSRSPSRGHKDSDRSQRKQSKSPVRNDNRRDGNRDGARTEGKQSKSPTRSDNRRDSGKNGARIEKRQSKSPTRNDSRRDGGRDGARTESKQSKSPTRSDNKKDSGRDGVRTEKRQSKSPTASDNKKDSGRDGARASKMEKQEADKGRKSKGDNDERRRSRSSSRSSSKKDSDRGSSDKSSRKEGSGNEEKSSQNGGTKKRERQLSADDKGIKLSRKEQIRRELENLDRELQETRRKRKEKRKMEGSNEALDENKDEPLPAESPPAKEDKKSSAMIAEQPKANDKPDTLDEFHVQKKKFKQLKKQQVKGQSREAQTLALLAKFQKKLHTAISEKPEEKEQGEVVEDEEEEETPEIKEEEDAGLNWATHSLHFEDHGPVLAKDANIEGADTFDIFDPRNPMNKRRRDESKRKSRSERKGRR